MAKGKPAGSKGARPGKPTKALVECCRKQHAGGNPLMLLIAVDVACAPAARCHAGRRKNSLIGSKIGSAPRSRRSTFGVQRPPGEHSAGHKKREHLRPYIVLRVLALNKFQGVPIDDGMFERVAREERRAALDAWGRYVGDLVRPMAANVVAMRH